MTLQRVADMREPPAVGRRYMVPFVRLMWCGKIANWPVLGPAHTDREFFNFPYRHYHVDARFLSKGMLRGSTSYFHGACDPVELSQRYPLSGPSTWQDGDVWAPLPDAVPLGRPSERPFRCVRVDTPYAFGGMEQVGKLRAKHGVGACAPIDLGDGRRLCPHRKVDLSNMVPDSDGVVTCPLHGLRVQMVEARS